MYSTQVEKFSSQAAEKLNIFVQRPAAIWVGGMLAGAYVGIGIILIMTLGNDVPPEFRKLVMGATFAIALTLVMFAGGELFTGYIMYTTFGVLKKRMTVSRAVWLCAAVWLANLLGAVLLALMYKLGGGMLTKSPDTVLQLIAHKKMNASAVQLFFNGVLCNWLVCLAFWMAARMNSDAAKWVGVFWCRFAFIASGYEHSIANMTVFSLALMETGIEEVSLAGAGFNLLWVTLGNTVSGVLFVGMSYWYMSKPMDAVVAEVVEGKRS